MKIHSGIQDEQVLQRQGKKGASVRIQGTSGQTGPVYATIFRGRRPLPRWKRTKVGLARKGRFTASLTGIPAGGPYRLDLQAGSEKVGITTFFVGDVWLLAGQSNMEGVGDMTGAATPHPLIRSFSMAREWSLAKDPLHDLRESPDVCHHQGQQLTPAQARQFRRRAKKGVGVGIYFAREMLKRTGVPQGLICTAHGGTSMTQWDPKRKGEGGASLYGSMLLSVQATGQPVAGLLWYQGESDANDADEVHYTDRIEKLVAATRRDLRQPSLPWLVVQLARFFEPVANATAWNKIQEYQRLLPGKIKNLEVVATNDLSLDDFIHLSAVAYSHLGPRLAHAADRLVLGNKKELRPPQLREARLLPAGKPSAGVFGPMIEVVFDQVADRLQAGAEPHGFTPVTAEGQPWSHCYKTTLHGRTVRLHLAKIPPAGIKLHYGHGVMPICNIVDGRGLALPTFGPVPLTTKEAYLPFVTTWKVTDIIESPSVPLGKLERPDLSSLPTTTKTCDDGFINQHPQWEKKTGQAYFSAKLTLPTRMKLEFLLGYDGPFRLWIGEDAFYTDLNGTNPCLTDQFRRTLVLPAGDHLLTVAMDLNGGLAWGFMLRFRRTDVTKAQLKNGTYTRPVYSV